MNQRKNIVVILNWNGWEDTISCCRSLLDARLVSSDILLFDNDSENDSVKRIMSYLLKESLGHESGYACISGQKTKLEDFDFGEMHVKLYAHPENLGFAKGCNVAADYAVKAGYTYLFLLNNDTVVEAGAFSRMLDTLIETRADIIVPQIRYFDKPELIWCCGGEISYWGKVKYYYNGLAANEMAMPDRFRIGFATGCCILTRLKLFADIGGFTEKFFFGEEDVEMCLRLKRQKGTIICDPKAVIYHKVGASIRDEPEVILRKSYIHYLNRIINMRSAMPISIWLVWRFIVCVKIYTGFVRKGYRPGSFVGHLMEDSRSLDGVSKKMFIDVMKNDIYKFVL